MTKSSLNIKIRNEIKDNADLFCSIRRSELAHHFKGCMVKKGLKIADIAERLEVSAANISRMLNGKQNLTLDNIHALADALQERVVIALESSWREDSVACLEGNYFRSDDKWSLSDMYLKASLSPYQSIDLEAANEEITQEFQWSGFCELPLMEQRA